MSTRDTWQKLEPVVPIRQIKKRLIVPAFTATSGPARGCLSFTGDQDDSIQISGLPDTYEDEFTMEAWIKSSANDNTSRIIGTVWRLTDANFMFKLVIQGGHVRVLANKSASTSTTISTSFIPFGEWVHIAATYDGTTVRIFINGIEDAGSTLLAADLDSDGANLHALTIGNNFDGTGGFIGLIDEFCLWSVARTADQMLWSYNKHKNPEETGLDYYFKFNDDVVVDTDLLIITNYVDDSTQIIVINGIYWEEDEDAPLGFGASFVPVEWPVQLGAPASFFFPVSKPSDAEFALIVRWTDEVVQRRYLFTVEGIDISPTLEAYNGEPLPVNGVVLEAWCKGQSQPAISLAADLYLYVSILTEPTTSQDVTPVSYDALVADITLAENFPLADAPFEFNTQQTY